MQRTWCSIVLPLLIAAGGCSSAPEEPAPPDTVSEDAIVEKARAIHQRVLTIDTHDDIPFDFATAAVDPGVRDGRQVTLPKMREGQLDVGFFIVYVGQTERTPAAYEKAKADALTKFEAIHRMAEEMYPDQIGLATSADEVEQIHASGRLVAAIGIENGFVIGRDLSLLKRYHDLGARYITLAHGGHNDIADSATPRENLGDAEEEHGGLSDFGREVVAEMNRLGIMVDVSHISKNAMLEATRLSTAPVIGSHSGMRAVNDHPRNMDDEQLLALKENGGVIQTVALGTFVKVDPPEKTAALEALMKELGLDGFQALRSASEDVRAQFAERRRPIDEKWPPADVQDFVDHIDHGVKLIGIDHVGISSDFDGGGGIEGWDDASETFNVTLELVRRGYTEPEIAKLWGGNLLRVWREVERVAAGLQKAGTE